MKYKIIQYTHKIKIRRIIQWFKFNCKFFIKSLDIFVKSGYNRHLRAIKIMQKILTKLMTAASSIVSDWKIVLISPKNYSYDPSLSVVYFYL